MRDHRRDDTAIRQMLRIATGRAERVKPDPHRLDNEGRQRAKPITLAPMPWDAKPVANLPDDPVDAPGFARSY
jgi:hypothetical protein